MFSILMSIAARHPSASRASSASRIIHGTGVGGRAPQKLQKRVTHLLPLHGVLGRSAWSSRRGNGGPWRTYCGTSSFGSPVRLDGTWSVGSSVNAVTGLGARGEFLPCRQHGCWRSILSSSPLSSLTSSASCGAGVDAGVEGRGVVFRGCTTWIQSRWSSTVGHCRVNRTARSVLHLRGRRIPVYSYMSLNHLRFDPQVNIP